ncbi:hypothetical protein Tco_1490276, partial [Tanacetum coccineum]
IVMSDLEDSTVTYTAVSSPFEGFLEIGSPRVDGPPMMPEDPYAYVVTDFQPLPATVSPTADSPGNILESDPEEDDDEDPEENLADYPTDRDDDGGEEEPSRDEANDEDKDEDDKEEEKEHPALADSVPPPLVHHTTTKISILAQAPVPFLSEEEVERFLAIPTPPPSPLTPLSSPLPHIPSPPLPVSRPLHISPPPLLANPSYPLGFRAAMIRQRAESPSTSHSLPLPPPIILSHTRASVAMMRAAAPSTYVLASRSETPLSETPPSGTPPLLPILLPIPSPPLLLPSTDRRADMPEVCLPPRMRLCISQGPRYEVRESSSAPRPTGGFRADYGFVATLDAEIRRDPERDVELGRRMTEFATVVRQDTDEIYRRLDETQDARVVLSGRLNLLQRDRRSHVYSDLLMEREARLSCEAWGRSMAASDAARSEVIALRTTVLDTGDSTAGSAGTRWRPAQPKIPEEAGSSS